MGLDGEGVFHHEAMGGAQPGAGRGGLDFAGTHAVPLAAALHHGQVADVSYRFATALAPIYLQLELGPGLEAGLAEGLLFAAAEGDELGVFGIYMKGVGGEGRTQAQLHLLPLHCLGNGGRTGSEEHQKEELDVVSHGLLLYIELKYLPPAYADGDWCLDGYGLGTERKEIGRASCRERVCLYV